MLGRDAERETQRADGWYWIDVAPGQATRQVVYLEGGFVYFTRTTRMKWAIFRRMFPRTAWSAPLAPPVMEEAGA